MSESEKGGAPAHLYAALAKATARAHAAPRDSVNLDDKYSYASAEAILGEARGALAEECLALLPLDSKIVPAPTGSPLWQSSWRLVHSSGESIELSREWPIVLAGRTLDKAAATADTSSLAYLVRDLLLLPRVSPGEFLDAVQKPKGEEKKPPASQPAAPVPSPSQEKPEPEPSRATPPPPDKVAAVRLDLLRVDAKALIKRLPSKDAVRHAWSTFHKVKRDPSQLRAFMEDVRKLLAQATPASTSATAANGSAP